jgi:hypothetical protein
MSALTPKISLLDMELELVALTDELLGYSERGEKPPEELLTAIAGGITATAEKRDRVAAFFRFVSAQPKLIDEEIRRLTLRKKTIEKGAEHLKDYVYRAMIATNQRAIEGTVSTFKIVKNPPHVEAPDTSILPDDLVTMAVSFKMTRARYNEIKLEFADLVEDAQVGASPDKKQIAEILKHRTRAVPGASLKTTERLEIK